MKITRFAFGFAIYAAIALIAAGLAAHIDAAAWASWVQAVGSLIAIGIAIYVTNRQAESAALLALSTETRGLVRQAKSVGVILRRVDNAIERCANAIEAQNLVDFRAAVSAANFLSAAVKALDQVPLYALGSADIVEAVIAARRISESLISPLKTMASFLSVHGNPSTATSIMANPANIKTITDAALKSRLACQIFDRGVKSLESGVN